MSFDKTKTDPALGKKVHEHLVSIGVETPVIDNGMSRKEKIDKIERNFDQRERGGCTKTKRIGSRW